MQDREHQDNYDRLLGPIPPMSEELQRRIKEGLDQMSRNRLKNDYFKIDDRVRVVSTGECFIVNTITKIDGEIYCAGTPNVGYYKSENLVKLF